MKPVSVWCYQIHAVLMMLFWGLFALGGLYFVIFGFSGTVFSPEEEAQILVYCRVSLIFGIPLTLLYGASLLLPRAKWSWFVHLVLICFGMTSWCFAPICIPLLIFYLKPNTRAWFGSTA